MFHKVTRPPTGVNESCIELTAPHDAAVVTAAVSGVRHLRKLVTQAGHQVVQLRRGDYRYN